MIFNMEFKFYELNIFDTYTQIYPAILVWITSSSGEVAKLTANK